MIPLVALVVLTDTSEPDAKTFRSWGSETLQMIRRDYSLPGSKLFGEEIEPGQRATQPAFNWGVGVMLSALAAAARVDPQYRPWVREYAEASRAYWNPEGPVAGYDVLPGPKSVDRYYDDNAWMVMALVETFEVLGDRKFLMWAEEALKYVLSGEDSQLGGGVYWKEAEKSSKNTCSNGPAAAAALAVYVHLRKPEYLDAAKRIYDWTQAHLRDPKDALYWDNVRLNGDIETTKWTYNSGLMLRTAIDLFRETKDERYRRDANELDSATAEHWIESSSGTVKDDGKFAHLLLENWARRTRILNAPGAWGRVGIKTLQFVHNHVRDEDHRYGNRWDRAALGKWPKPMLIDQASAARAYFVAADMLNRRR